LILNQACALASSSFSFAIIALQEKISQDLFEKLKRLNVPLTPLYMSWTSCTSENPILLLLETSKMPPSDSECSPWIPLIWTWFSAAIFSKVTMSLERRGSLTWIEALRPVPILVGQLKINIERVLMKRKNLFEKFIF